MDVCGFACFFDNVFGVHYNKTGDWKENWKRWEMEKVIDQIATVIVMLLCSIVASIITITFSILFINVMCLAGLCFMKLRNVIFKVWYNSVSWLSDDLFVTLSSIVFAPAYWALKKMDEEKRKK